jgi:hypothetical protein
MHCESVLNQCQAVRESVWDGFIAEITPTLRTGYLRAQSRRMRNCLGTITECVANACRDDIAGTGKDTEDACLAHPEMARSFCTVEIESCDRNGNFWSFVEATLAARRVTACTKEVHNCFANENACGADFGKCLGLDLNALYNLCPLESLVVCRQGNPDFSLDDLEEMVMGIFMNIDNKQLDDCMDAINERMEEICGHTAGCRHFLGENIGASSLRYVEFQGYHMITGLVNWGNIQVSAGAEWSSCVLNNGRNCDRFPQAGTLMMNEYISGMKDAGENVRAVLQRYIAGSNSSVEEELKSVVGEINRMVSMLEADQRIGWCIHGRDMSQITGNRGEATQARFPTLTQTQRRIMAEAALGTAVQRHNVRIQELMREAEGKMDSASAEYLCYIKPTMTVGRAVPEPNDPQTFGSYESARIIGQVPSAAVIDGLKGNHTRRIDSVLTKTTWVEYFALGTRQCRICVSDRFHGQRRFVDPRAGEAEALKAELARIDQEIKDENEQALMLAAAATTAALTGVLIAVGTGVAAIVPVGTIIVAAVAVVALAVVGIFHLTRKRNDPNKEVITRTVDYCFTDVIGASITTADRQAGADTIRGITNKDEAKASGANVL